MADNGNIEILVTDLEAMQQALHNLYYLSLSLDLQNQYRVLDASGKVSPLTTQAEEALTKANALIELVDEDADQAE